MTGQKPEKETPLAGRRAGDAIASGVTRRDCNPYKPKFNEKKGMG